MQGRKVPEFEKGNTVTIRSKVFNREDVHVSPDLVNDEHDVRITITRSKDGEVFVDDEDMRQVPDTSPAVFDYSWQTEPDFEEGEYYVTTSAEAGNTRVVNRDRIRLSDIVDC